MTFRGALAEFLDTTLKIRPGEGRRTGLLFVHLLLASAVFFLGRTVRDTLFLSRFSLAALPWMFVVYGAASAATAILYARVADRLPIQRLIALACGAGIGTYVVAWALVRGGVAWVYPVFYVWTEIVSTLFIVQFWTLAAELFDARTAKRVFGPIGSARLVGSVLVGLGTGAIVTVIGTAQLVLVLAGLMVAITVVATRIGREARTERAVRAAPARRRGPPPAILGDGYVGALALILLVAFTAVNIGDFQFKAMARATYREDELARFFSLFYAGTGTLSFLFQLFVTPRLLARLGVTWGMTVMPSAFGTASVLLRFFPGLGAVTAMKFADNGFQYAIQETTFQALYVPFPPETKARTRAFLEAVIKPAGFALAGLTVILLGGAFAGEPARFTIATLPLTVAWLALIPVVKRRYRRRLEATLSARGSFALDQEFLLDSEGRQALLRALDSAGSRQVLVALEQLAGERAPEVARAVERLAAHADPVVRAAALMHIAHTGDGVGAPALAALRDPVADVRAAAAAAYAATVLDESIDALAPLLADPAADVRVAALAGLLKHGGVEGGIVGGAELGRLLASGRQADLVDATRALRHLGRSAARPLRRLLADPDPVVRRAAAKAAPGVADPRLVPVLIGLLEDPACRHRAGQALVAIGEPAVAPLAALLTDPGAGRNVRLEVPRLLRRIPLPATWALLRSQAHTSDSHLRLRVLAALSELRRELHRRESLAAVTALVTAEIADADANAAGWTRARAEFATPLLEEEFALRRRQAVRRLLRALELRYDAESLRLVRERLGDPVRRANALEVLDTLLETPLRPLVMPFVDDDPKARRRLPPAPEPVAFLVSQCHHPNPYVAALALHALARRVVPAADAEARALLDHPDPLVREIAARTLDGGGPTPEGAMYSTVEKILFLKSAPVFERVAGEDLAPLARVAEVEQFAPGQRLITRGEPGDALYVITRGKVTIGDDGRTIAELGPGDTIGEMAVLDNEPRVASATAAAEVEVLRIGSEAFYEILHEQVEIAEGVIRVLCGRLRDADAQLIGRRSLA